MKVIVLRIVIVSLALYTLFPMVLTNVLGFYVIKKGYGLKKIAFTFDDGPDPVYTVRLLDLLKKYEIKATFFVIGSKIGNCPEIIYRMHKEGHLIGIHNYLHHSNWLMMPWKVKQQIEVTSDLIERITGVQPVFYRPPWGLLNLFDLLLLKQFRITLWSVMVGDWKCKNDKQLIKRRLLENIRDGSIIVLHDSGETFGADLNAPFYMLDALEEVLQEVIRQGYDCVRVDELIPTEVNQAYGLYLSQR